MDYCVFVVLYFWMVFEGIGLFIIYFGVGMGLFLVDMCLDGVVDGVGVDWC